MPLEAETSQMDLGKPVMEPDLESQSKSIQAPQIPKGGEI